MKMTTFLREAFRVKRRSYPERIRAALFLAIKRTAANLDACVKLPGKDFSRTRKLPLQAMLLMLIGMGSGSLSKELYDSITSPTYKKKSGISSSAQKNLTA